MPVIRFRGGPMDGKEVRVSKLEPKFWFKECLYYRKGKALYLAESIIKMHRDIASQTTKAFAYGKSTAVE